MAELKIEENLLVDFGDAAGFRFERLGYNGVMIVLMRIDWGVHGVSAVPCWLI